MQDVVSWIGSTVDVAVIGAGAAGLGAARRLQIARPDLSVLVLEAGSRTGGRAWTVAPPVLVGNSVDLGCGWLHGARTNAWTHIADELGFTVERTPAPWDKGGRDLGLDAQSRKDSNAALDSYFARVKQRTDRESDGALADLLEPDNRWNDLIGAIGTYINGVELAQASIADYNNYQPGPGPDWRVREGYGRLVSRFGAPVPVTLGTVVTRIDHRDAAIKLETNRGTLSARAVVISVSTNMLAAETIRFDPPLPEKTKAAAGLPLGLANKLFLRVDSPELLPVEGHVIGSPYRTGTGIYQIRSFGAPLIEAYFAGQLAHDLERASENAALAFAKDELASHFGNDVRGRLELAAASAWARTPHIGGSYSYAKPGASAERSILAAPVDGRLFFAGEACSASRFSTAHGAYETGFAVADQIAGQL